MAGSIETTTEQHGVQRITLTRSDVHNAFDDKVIKELHETLDALKADNPRVLVLQAQGKSFSAGADLNWMKKSANYSRDENFRDAQALSAMLNALDSFPATTIASIQGTALGGGVGLAACCDIAIASTAAVFALTEVRLGLIPGTISPFVVRAIGPRQARRYFTTAERFDAATAQRIGLVHEVVEPDVLSTKVDELITQLLQSSPDAQRKAKNLVNQVAPRVMGGLDGKGIDQSLLDDTAASIADARASDEGREGVSAFLEKRKPNWIVS